MVFSHLLLNCLITFQPFYLSFDVVCVISAPYPPLPSPPHAPYSCNIIGFILFITYTVLVRCGCNSCIQTVVPCIKQLQYLLHFYMYFCREHFYQYCCFWVRLEKKSWTVMCVGGNCWLHHKYARKFFIFYFCLWCNGIVVNVFLIDGGGSSLLCICICNFVALEYIYSWRSLLSGPHLWSLSTTCFEMFFKR